MQEATVNNDSFIGKILGIFRELLQYWILERDTKSEEFFAFATLAFGIFQAQPKNTLTDFAVFPPMVAVFDDAVGFSLIVVGLIHIWAIWSRNLKLKINMAFINIFIWSGYSTMFIYKGVAPGAYILPFYVLYLTAAYFRNSWEEEHGAIKQYTKLPSYAVASPDTGHNSRDHHSFNSILQAAFHEIVKESRYRFGNHQDRI